MKKFELLNCIVSVKGEMIRRTDKSIVGFCFRSFADRFTHLFAENTASGYNCSQQNCPQEVLFG